MTKALTNIRKPLRNGWLFCWYNCLVYLTPPNNRYIRQMTFEQKKISLINWITNINDESLLDEVVALQRSKLDDLPEAIVELLEIAHSEPDESLKKHTSVKDMLK